MRDILNELASTAFNRVESGYYDIYSRDVAVRDHKSFRQALRGSVTTSIIAELKPGSPSRGRILKEDFDPVKLAELYASGGALGLSVLTVPEGFFGSLGNVEKASVTGLPVLMKDFIIDRTQIEAARAIGADAILFIHRLFDRGYTSFELNDGINYAQELGLEVLLEVNDLGEYESALKTEADMIGINNRDLRSLNVDISLTKRILAKYKKDRPVWSLSGISSREDINYLKGAGADAFLIGTSLVEAREPDKLLQDLCGNRSVRSKSIL